MIQDLANQLKRDRVAQGMLIGGAGFIALLFCGICGFILIDSRSRTLAAQPQPITQNATPAPPAETSTPTVTATYIPTRTPAPVTPEISEEEAKFNWGHVDVRDLARYPDNYIGREVHYTGEIFSIEEDSEGTYMQVWIQIPGGDDWDTEAVIIVWPGNGDGLYEGTQVEVWGYVVGAFEGTNAFGGTIRQPTIRGKYLTYFTE